MTIFPNRRTIVFPFETLISFLDMDGACFSPADSSLLALYASRMLRKNESQVTINQGGFCGVLKTEFLKRALIDITGIEFTAEIPTQKGISRLKFILRRPLTSQEVNELVWTPAVIIT